MDEELVAQQIRAELHAGLQQFIEQPLNDTTRHRVRAVIACCLKEKELAGVTPPDFWQTKVREGAEYTARGIIDIYMVRNFAKFRMTEAEYRDTFNREPTNDDLERINCGQAGGAGHFCCGWCMDHETARFECGCIPR